MELAYWTTFVIGQHCLTNVQILVSVSKTYIVRFWQNNPNLFVQNYNSCCFYFSITSQGHELLKTWIWTFLLMVCWYWKPTVLINAFFRWHLHLKVLDPSYEILGSMVQLAYLHLKWIIMGLTIIMKFLSWCSTLLWAKLMYMNKTLTYMKSG